MTGRRRRRLRAGAVAGLAVVACAGVLALGVAPDAGPVPDRTLTQHAAATAPRTPEQSGAVGDGRTDDTDALQAAFDGLQAGDALQLRDGAVYRHDSVLVVRRPGVRLTGAGTLLATEEEHSSLQVRADGVRLDGVTLRTAPTTRRWTGLDQHRLVLGRHRGIVVEDVHVEGSAGAGVYVDGAVDFRLVDLLVTDTRADGVHMTNGAAHGLVVRPRVLRSGDDGVAVVSYSADRGTTRHIRVESPTVLHTRWGRGVSVVGGEDVVYRDVTVEDTSAAGVYVASEGAPFFTRDTRRVRMTGVTVRGANRSREIDHGAVLLYAGREGSEVRDVRLSGVSVQGTRASASRQVGLLADGGTLGDVVLASVDVTGGGNVFDTVGPVRGHRLEGWTVDGREYAEPDR